MLFAARARGTFWLKPGRSPPYRCRSSSAACGGLDSVSDGFRCLGVSAANEVGEHGLVAELEDGETAAYRLDAEGRLSLILKSGSATDGGPVTRVGAQHRSKATAPAISLNARGEIALIVQISGGPDTIVLLTPTQR
jgi:hypothetical protein